MHRIIFTIAAPVTSLIFKSLYANKFLALQNKFSDENVCEQ